MTNLTCETLILNPGGCDVQADPRVRRHRPRRVAAAGGGCRRSRGCSRTRRRSSTAARVAAPLPAGPTPACTRCGQVVGRALERAIEAAALVQRAQRATAADASACSRPSRSRPRFTRGSTRARRPIATGSGTRSRSARSSARTRGTCRRRARRRRDGRCRRRCSRGATTSRRSRRRRGAATTERACASSVHGRRPSRPGRAARLIDVTVVRDRGDGFLRHMVRNIVGTLVEVGRGRRPPGVDGGGARVARPRRARADGAADGPVPGQRRVRYRADVDTVVKSAFRRNPNVA